MLLSTYFDEESSSLGGPYAKYIPLRGVYLGKESKKRVGA